jgi:hypothetical protein
MAPSLSDLRRNFWGTDPSKSVSDLEYAALSKLTENNLNFGSFPLSVDELTSIPPVAAYSLRKVVDTYAGPAINVRRSSDDTTQDIGFLPSGDLDIVALQSFIGVNNGFISIWYDQCPSPQNAAQATFANQPIIATAGVIERTPVGNKAPAVLGSATTVLSSANFAKFATIQKSISTVSLEPALAATNILVSNGTGNYYVSSFSNHASVFSYIDSIGSRQISMSVRAIGSLGKRIDVCTLNTYTYSINGTELYRLNAGNIIVPGNTSLTLMGGLALGWPAHAQEMLFYNYPLSATEQAYINANQTAYYG